MTIKKASTRLLNSFGLSLLLLFVASLTATAQTPSPQPSGTPAPTADAPSDGIALAPARFELEMMPGTETTVVVNLDYHMAKANAQPSRIVATLNDWTISPNGELEFFRAGTRPDSAASWMIYSPGEVVVQPGQMHTIRVTISVPKDATPGDHLAALVVEQRPDTIKLNRNARQVLLRFRMASMFYINVPQSTRRGSLENLKAAVDSRGIVVTPTLKNSGNSVVRPISSVRITDAAGRTVAEMPENETLPVLGGAEMTKPLLVEKELPPGAYTVRYKVDFQGNGKAVEGVTDLTVGESEGRKVLIAGAPEPE